MSTTVIKGSDLLPEIIARYHLDPDKAYEIRERQEYEEDNIPPEEMFREDFIKEVEQSSKEAKEGKGIVCKDAKEVRELFNKWQTEND